MLQRLLGFAVLAVILLPVVCRAQESRSAVTPNSPRIKVSEPVQVNSLIRKVIPSYPDQAKADHLTGTVVMHVIVATDGSVGEIHAVSGPAVLANRAISAVGLWKYRVTLLDGTPAEVETQVTLVFKIDDSGQTSVEEVPAGNSPRPQAVPSPGESADKPIDPQLKADIQHLLATMKGQEAAEAGIRATFDSLRPQLEASLPRTPNRGKIIDAYEDKLVDLVRTPGFQDGITAIYAKHFTDEDIKAVDAFYQTPAGQHFITELPAVIQESSQFGQQTTVNGIPGILKELCQQFVELQGAVDFCPADEKQRQSRLNSAPAAPPVNVSSLIKREGN